MSILSSFPGGGGGVTSVWIKKTAAEATSDEDRAKLLIDTSDDNILKYWDSTLGTPAWVAVVGAWG